MHKTPWTHVLLGLVGLVLLVSSCLGGGRTPGDKCAQDSTNLNPTAPSASASVSPVASGVVTAAPIPSGIRRPSRSERYEAVTGVKLSMQDKALMDDCPDRPWSKHVPEGECMRDEECGDGFCDRNNCAPIWTCGINYGQRCRSDEDCNRFLCREGRCRSCLLTIECLHLRDQLGTEPECDPHGEIPGARMCYGDPMNIPGGVAMPPP